MILLSASELTIGRPVIAWPVVAAALGVLVIGFGALNGSGALNRIWF